jgi:hypothetical protein
VRKEATTDGVIGRSRAELAMMISPQAFLAALVKDKLSPSPRTM